MSKKKDIPRTSFAIVNDLKRRLNEDTDNFPWQNELNAPFFLLFLPMSMENLIGGWNL